jgi:hypothetical protein
MMEQWNSGVMGSGIMQCWINGPATGGIDDKIKMAVILLKPIFQRSTIPLFHFRGKFKSPKIPLSSQ